MSAPVQDRAFASVAPLLAAYRALPHETSVEGTEWNEADVAQFRWIEAVRVGLASRDPETLAEYTEEDTERRYREMLRDIRAALPYAPDRPVLVSRLAEIVEERQQHLLTSFGMESFAAGYRLALGACQGIIADLAAQVAAAGVAR